MTLDEIQAATNKGLLLPFHEVTKLEWDEKTKTGRVEAARRNRIDDWFYSCHFIGDPVMPGCWGIDAVWQCMRVFAAWRGLPRCSKTLGMENVSFFGQIRPHDQKIVYSVDILSIEEDGGEALMTAKAAVSVDGTPVYTIGSAQLGSAYWESDPAARPPGDPAAADGPMRRTLTYDEFAARASFSQAEVIALSLGALIKPASGEIGLLPSSLMLEVGRVRRIGFDEATGEGRIVASKANGPLEWYYPMSGGVKPTALTIDAVWQLLGVFLTWRRSLGTGRALGFEKVEVFGEITPADQEIVYEVQILRMTRAEAGGDTFVRADAKVWADGRLILACANANVGCHRNIRYSDYPAASEMGFGGKLRTRALASGS